MKLPKRRRPEPEDAPIPTISDSWAFALGAPALGPTWEADVQDRRGPR